MPGSTVNCLTCYFESYSQVLVDLLGFPVLFEESPEHSHSPDPDNLLGHTSVGGTLPLARTAVTSLAAGLGILADTGARVHRHGLTDDQTVLDELANVLTCTPSQLSVFQLTTVCSFRRSANVAMLFSS